MHSGNANRQVAGEKKADRLVYGPRLAGKTASNCTKSDDEYLMTASTRDVGTGAGTDWRWYWSSSCYWHWRWYWSSSCYWHRRYCWFCDATGSGVAPRPGATPGPVTHPLLATGPVTDTGPAMLPPMVLLLAFCSYWPCRSYTAWCYFWPFYCY